MKTKNNVFFIFLMLVISSLAFGQKPRTIVTTDGEIDDVDSFIRMLLYSNEFNIEGLVISSSMWHYKGDDKGTLFTSEMEMTKKIYGAIPSLRWPGTEWMNPLIDAYEEVYPKLSQHAEDYPKADYLRSLIKVGNIDFEGEMEKITDGSEFIKDKLMDETTEPIYLQVWGGTNSIARALKSIQKEYQNSEEWDTIYKKVSEKAIIYAILDQDATYRKYIAPNWPDIKIFYNSNQFWCFAYPWKSSVPEDLHYLFEGDFMGNKIINNHGSLLKQYYSYGDGQKQKGDDEHIHGDLSKMKGGQWGTFGKYDFISEGDSPAYLHLVNVGLDNLNNPEYGGLGGRLVQSAVNPKRWEDGENALDFNPYTNKMDASYPQTRWVEVIQNDFAARADWCVLDYKNANHPPKIKSKNQVFMNAGETTKIKVKTSDPDKNKVNVSFWQYQEAGNSDLKATINAKGNVSKITVPISAKKGDTFHVIAEAKDNGENPMTRFQRIILIVN
jgi:hypothetical protein